MKGYNGAMQLIFKCFIHKLEIGGLLLWVLVLAPVAATVITYSFNASLL